MEKIKNEKKEKKKVKEKTVLVIELSIFGKYLTKNTRAIH